MIFVAILLGLVQGLTEFLPISSSAHIRIVTELVGAGDWGAGFSAICQIGTEIAVIVYFRNDIKNILLHWFAIFSPNSRISLTAERTSDSQHLVKFWPRYFARVKRDPYAKLGWWIILGSLPAIILGVVLKDVIKTDFRNLWMTGLMLITFGLVLGLLDRFSRQTKVMADLTVWDTLVFGIGQALALIPGVSRSGGSISAGRLLGYDRNASARFAFLLAVPAVFGSGLFETVDVLSDLPPNFPGLVPTLIAILVSFIVGYLVIIVFLKIVTTYSYAPFVIYRIILGAAILLALGTGVLRPF